jgi:hypothetical protein
MTNLSPIHVTNADKAIYKVEKSGWYAFDDNHAPILGPFDSRKKCVKAIEKAERNKSRK